MLTVKLNYFIKRSYYFNRKIFKRLLALTKSNPASLDLILIEWIIYQRKLSAQLDIGQPVLQNKMSFYFPVNIAILLSFIIFVFCVLGFHNIFTSYQKNDCDMTFMFQYPQFVEISLSSEVQKAYPKYALYGYGEGGITENLRKMNFKGIPVLFVPGSSGSYKQGRSLASVSLRKSLNSRSPFHFNYFMVDFNEEQSALFGGVLKDQTKFVLECIKKILMLYEKNDKNKRPNSVILIGHSMGGLLTKGVFMDPEFDPKLVRLVISLATPHKYPVVQPDYYITSYYKDLNNFWKDKSTVNHTFLISIGGGPKDILVHSYVISDRHADINVVTTAVPGVWLPNDHLSILWCKPLVITIIRSIFDSVDISTKQLFTDKEHIRKIFQYHFLKRSAGKRFSTSLTNRFSTFERSMNWFENLQRQFTITESKGLSSNHYIMIRLFSDTKNEAAFIEAYNINIKDWIFVCVADVVYNSIRMCDSGENISNMTEIAPVDMNLHLKRKFVYLNLHELKAKSFTHVIVKLPPSGSYMSLNVDVHQPSKRNFNHQVPKFYSLSPNAVIEETQENSAYYSVHLVDFEYIWQSFILKLKVLSCKSQKNQAVVSFITPWANENRHFIFQGNNLLEIPLYLLTPKPKDFNATLFPEVKLHLDPTCKYQLTIQTYIIGMFAQGARYYLTMLPAFVTAVLLLTLRQKIKYLDEGECVLFHSALSAAVRPYYIILQASVIGSKVLGLGFFLSILPEPDFLTLQELNLDSFFLTILLYGVAVILVYSGGAAVYISVIFSGQAAKKMALRLFAKAISGVFNWSDWVIASLHQMPFFVSIILISISVSASGALSLWLGTFFYFLKLCKMYEEYLEDWFNYSLKFLAKKVKNLISKKTNQDNPTPGKIKEKGKNDENKETKKITESQSESKANFREVETLAKENESDSHLLAAIHFHVSIFLVWLLLALLYIPTLLFWVKNYYYSASLEKDPSLLPSIIVSICGAVLWQPDVPKSCRKLSTITSSSLFLLAVVSIIYASLSTFRLGYILSASLLIVSLNQIASKYMQD